MKCFRACLDPVAESRGRAPGTSGPHSSKETFILIAMALDPSAQ
jgi:hypothetical protein